MYVRWLAALARLVIRHRLPVLLVTAALYVLGGVYVLAELRPQSSVDSVLEMDGDLGRSLDDLEAAFGHDQVFMVLVRGDVFTTEFMDRLEDLHEALAAVRVEAPGPDGPQSLALDQVMSLVNAHEPAWKDGALTFESVWADDRTDGDRILANPRLVGQFVGADGEHAVILARTQAKATQDVRRLLAQAIDGIVAERSGPGFECGLAGHAALLETLDELSTRDTLVVIAAASVILSLCLIGLMRRPLAVMAAMWVVQHALVATLVAMGLLDIPITVATGLLGCFVLVTGTSDAVHIQSVTRQRLSEGADPTEAVVDALALTGIPVLLTSLTTAIAMGTFLGADTYHLREVGGLAAFGTGMALFHSLVTLPALLSYSRPEAAGSVAPAPFVAAFARRMVGLSATRTGRYGVLAGFAAVVALSLAGASRVRVLHDPMDLLPEDHPIRVTVTEIEHEVGGTSPIHLLIDAPEGHSVDELALIEGLARVEQRFLALPRWAGHERDVRTTGLLDVLRLTWTTLVTPAHGGEVLPDSQRGVYDSLMMFEAAQPAESRSILTLDRRTALVTFWVPWGDNIEYEPVLRALETAVQEEVGDLATVRVTGGLVQRFWFESTLLNDLLRGFAMGFTLVALLMALMLRGLRLGLLAMIPNLLPILMVLGTIGAFGIPLNLNTTFVPALVLGIAVDDTLHFMHHFRLHLQSGGSVEDAIVYSGEKAGHAMVITSILLVAGFLAPLLAETPTLRAFGALVAVSMTFALFADLVVAPALLRTVYGRRPQ